MLAYPPPPLAPFQVTLLPEQTQTSSSSSGGPSSSASAAATANSVQHAMEASRRESWTAAVSMLHSILELAGDYHKPQEKFAAYSPEKVMRSVRDIVDDDRCMELVELLQRAVRDYAERCVVSIAELRRQRQSAIAATASSPLTPSRHGPQIVTTATGEVDSFRDEDNHDEDAVATLDTVQTLAILVTYYERLQHGIAELSSVWVYANQWCSLQNSREVPRLLGVASTQEWSAVFRNAAELFEVALRGYGAVLKAELVADTATLDAPTTATAAASAFAAVAATAASATALSEVAQLKSPAATADVKMDASTLELLACPPSLAHLTVPLRRRLLFLFMQLTRESQQYNTRVEPVVVQMVRSHFEDVANRWWAEEVSAKRYFQLSETALKRADAVGQQFLHSGTIPLIEDAIQATLIGSVGAEVLKRDFTALMEQEEFHALRLAWRLLSSSAHVRSAPAVVTLFREYLLECGRGIMEELVPGSTKVTLTGAQAAATARERPFLAVRHVIGLLEQGSRTVEKCFHECEKEFKVALHEALQTILEAYPNAFSEQLAAYQDAIMKEVEVGHVPLSLSKHQTTVASTNPAAPAVSAAGAALAAHTSPSSHLHDEEQGGPRGSSYGGSGGAGDEKGDTEAQVEEEEEEGRLGLRRLRAEVAPAPSPVTTGAATCKEGGAAAAAAAQTNKDEENNDTDATLGAAALRHAAPLPAEAREATPVLRRIAFIYSYHPKKDLFEAAYWRDFARRCLQPHRKVDVAAENAFIFYLRDICGLSFTSKFEGMLTDLESSAQLSSQFKAWCEEQTSSADVLAGADDENSTKTAGQRSRHSPTTASLGGSAAVETQLLILAQSFWPRYAPQPPHLYVPPSLQRTMKAVEQFYAGLFPNRRLTWQHPLAHATLRAQLTPQSAVLSITGTYTQCMLLMRLDALYDKGVTAVTVKALCEAVGLDCTNTEVLWLLQGLCHPRLRLLLCKSQTTPARTTTTTSRTAASASGGEAGEEGTVSPQNTAGDDEEDGKAFPTSTQGGQLAPQDLVLLNLAFTSNTAKVRIPLQTRARATATAGTDGGSRGARTADNGGHLVEVAIVSCMKARRTVSHADLVAEVNSRLPFAVSVPVLKKSIEKMIERGFMVRGKDNMYHFSA